MDGPKGSVDDPTYFEDSDFWDLTNSTSTNVTSANISQSSFESQYEYLYGVVRSCNAYLIPTIIFVGIFGNIISFIVFAFSKLRRISSSVYLAALAVSEIGFLVCAGISWLDSTGIGLFHLKGFCQIFIFMTYIFSFASIWYITAFTLEIYIAIFYIEKAGKICKTKSAGIIVCSLLGFSIVVYMFSFWTSETILFDNHILCIIAPHANVTVIAVSLTDTVLTLLIPFSLLVFMNTRILIDVMALYSRNRQHRRSVPQVEEPAVPEGQFRSQKKLKKTLITTVVVFLVLNLPSHALRLQAFLRSMLDPSYTTTEIEHLLQQLFQMLYYLNFVVNFFIYNACAKCFRRVLIDLIVRLFQMLFCKRSSRPSPRYKAARALPQSHLVELHISQIRWSQMSKIDNDFVAESPPCFIQIETAN